MAPQAAEIRRELAEGAGAVVENSPLPLPDDVVRCAGAALEGELSELELVRRIRREAPPPKSPPSEDAAAARGGAAARESPDEELVRACRDSKLVERQKELLTGALEAKVWRPLFLCSSWALILHSCMSIARFSIVVHCAWVQSSQARKSVQMELDPSGGVFENNPLVNDPPKVDSASADETLTQICRDSKLVAKQKEALRASLYVQVELLCESALRLRECRRLSHLAFRARAEWAQSSGGARYGSARRSVRERASERVRRRGAPEFALPVGRRRGHLAHLPRLEARAEAAWVDHQHQRRGRCASEGVQLSTAIDSYPRRSPPSRAAFPISARCMLCRSLRASRARSRRRWRSSSTPAAACLRTLRRRPTATPPRPPPPQRPVSTSSSCRAAGARSS